MFRQACCLAPAILAITAAWYHGVLLMRTNTPHQSARMGAHLRAALRLTRTQDDDDSIPLANVGLLPLRWLGFKGIREGAGRSRFGGQLRIVRGARRFERAAGQVIETAPRSSPGLKPVALSVGYRAAIFAATSGATLTPWHCAQAPPWVLLSYSGSRTAFARTLRSSPHPLRRRAWHRIVPA